MRRGISTSWSRILNPLEIGLIKLLGQAPEGSISYIEIPIKDERKYCFHAEILIHLRDLGIVFPLRLSVGLTAYGYTIYNSIFFIEETIDPLHN